MVLEWQFYDYINKFLAFGNFYKLHFNIQCAIEIMQLYNLKTCGVVDK